MPRPSDLYATSGAPGVYQATCCTPSPLPNVYVFPPEEDNQDVYCLFHSGSALPTAFESFYNHPVYIQRDPNSPTLSHLTALDHAISYFQRQSATHNSARYDPSRSWEDDEQIQRMSRNNPLSNSATTSSRSSFAESFGALSDIETETNIYSNVGEAETLSEEEWASQSKSPSRRSFVFADRPPGYEAFIPHIQEDESTSTKRPQTRTLRSRAITALKGLGSAITRRPEGQGQVIPEHGGTGDGSAVYQSWFEPTPVPRKRSRRTLARLFNSHVDDVPSHPGVVDLDVPPTHPSSSVRDLMQVDRKSTTQVFGLGRTSMERGTVANIGYPRLDMRHPAASSSASLASPAVQPKLAKRRSMTQLLGLGRGGSPTELSDHSVVAVDADETWPEKSEVPRFAASQSLGEPYSSSCASTARADTTESASKGSQFVDSQTGSTASPGRPKSFLGRRGFSFLDLHRHFATDHGSQAEHAPPTAQAHDPSLSFSPDSLSEGTDSSSSVAASTEGERTAEDDIHHFPMPQVSTAAIMGHGHRVALAGGFVAGRNVLSGSQLELGKDVEDASFSPAFGLDTPGEEEEEEEEEGEEEGVGSERGEDPPMLDLGMRLDSLTFDQLLFDPESFTAGSFYD